MDQFKTPPIPTWIKQIAHPQYRNVFSFGLGNLNLWGTETLLGDWDGEYLLVAKDFYPSSYIAEGIARGEARCYRHNPFAPTNRNLVKTLRHFKRLSANHESQDCGFMYISACFLLRNDGQKRGPLPDAVNALRQSAPVVQFTIDNMPHLRKIVLMGRDAEEAFRMSGSHELALARAFSIHSVRHPSYAMSDEDRYAEWESILR